MLEVLTGDEEIVVSRFTIVEITSALARRHREDPDEDVLKQSRTLLDELSRNWTGVTVDDAVLTVATDMLFRHPLKASDALQLASVMSSATAGQNASRSSRCTKLSPPRHALKASPSSPSAPRAAA